MKKEKTKNYHQEVANVSVDLIRFFDKTFSKVHLDGPKLDPEEIQKSPLMLVSTHRSHVDYFMWGINLFALGFKNLRFAAGDNLTKLPWIGPRFLAFGAFAVSRDSGFERNYVRNLCARVQKMIEGGDAVLVFPEGGRSYNGEMLEIRGGILNAALMAQAADLERDVYLLPAAVSYESPPDVPHFPMLLKGKKLRKKPNGFFKRLLGAVYYFGADIMAFGPFMLARFFGRRYGETFMDYAEPVSVKSLVDLEANRIQKARDEFAAHKASLDIVGGKIHEIFTSLYRILPIHIISAALKQNGGSAGRGDLEKAAAEIKASLAEAGRNCKTIGSLAAEEIVTKGIASLRRLKAVKIKKDTVSVNKKKLHIIEYFAAAGEKLK